MEYEVENIIGSRVAWDLSYVAWRIKFILNRFSLRVCDIFSHVKQQKDTSWELRGENAVWLKNKTKEAMLKFISKKKKERT